MKKPIKLLSCCVAIFLMLFGPLASAGKVYQYKDANGNIVFSDQPQPGQKAEAREVKTNSIQTSGGGFALRDAIKKNPVVLWATTSCGTPCDDARNLLQSRGIPYAGRSPVTSAENLAEFKKLAGDSMVPVLQVGGVVQRGFQEEEWRAALDAAGYPKSPDPTYKNQAPESNAPKPAPFVPQVQVPAKPR